MYGFSLEIMIVESFYNEMSCSILLNFITEGSFTKYTNIRAKLKQKIFTKVIRKPNIEIQV
jgi:hypothetical protein